jgi:hypothetical protein
MNEMHLEHDEETKSVMAELTEAVHGLTNEQEMRQTALAFAIQVYLKPGELYYNDVISLAEGFYKFLTDDLDG